MIVRIVLLLLCTMVALGGKAWAQLFLEDAKKVLAVSGGDHLNGSLLIHNTSSDPEDIKVYWEDFEYRPPYDGTKNFFPAGTGPGSASQWITFSPPVFTMPAFGKQKVDYSVTVPSSIKEGHYGVLFFEKSGTPLNDGGGLTLVERVGCLFFIEPKNKAKKALLQDVTLKGSAVNAGFVNQANVVLIPHTTYYLMEDGGVVLLRGDAKKAYVSPGATATIEIPLKDKLKQGRYTLVINSDLDEGDVVVKEIGLTVDDAGQISIVNSQD